MTAFAEIDAVTLDSFGTIVEFRGDVVGRLHRLAQGQSRERVERAAEAEFRYYRAHAHEGRDDATLAKLHADCARVFSGAVGVPVDARAFNAAFEVAVMPGVRETLRRLRARGLALAVVSNWDYGLHAQLRLAGLAPYFDTVVTSAEAGARKPDPRPLRVALERLGVAPGRAVHVGDHAPHDEVGAKAAGMRFAPAPLATAFEGWA